MANGKKVNGTNSNELVQYIVDEGREMAEKEFAKFSAILAVFFTCGL